MSDWINADERLPDAVGHLSDAVLVLCETGPDVACYDFTIGGWVLPNEEYNATPWGVLFWCPIPNFPEGFEI